MKRKSWIWILVTLILLISITSLIKNIKKDRTEISENIEKNIIEDYILTLEDGTLKNNSEKLKSKKEFNGFQIYNIRITSKDNETKVMFDVINISKVNKNEENVTFVMNDKEENEIGRVGIKLPKLEINKTATLELNLSDDFIKTYDIEILDEEISFLKQGE